MIEHAPNILILGGGESPYIYADRFVDPQLNRGYELPNVTLFDPHAAEPSPSNLPNFINGLESGNVEYTQNLPRQHFDITVITESPQRFPGLIQHLINRSDQMSLFAWPDPVATSHQELAWFRERELQLDSRSIVNAPYLFLYGMLHMSAEAQLQPTTYSNALREVRLSAEGHAGNVPHSQLDAYGIGVPAMHAAASRIARKILGLNPDHLIENTYKPASPESSAAEELCVRFAVDETDFQITQHLKQNAAPQNPENLEGLAPQSSCQDATLNARHMSLHFADGLQITLDLQSAFPDDPAKQGRTEPRYYDGDDLLKVKHINPDDPPSRLVTLLLEHTRYPKLRIPSFFTLQEALQRSEVLLALRIQATKPGA